jgi:glycosyltransferase involved in cell wall biosynthesis
MIPSISIQIPTFNQSSYIVEAVESAVNQSYDHKSIFVLDDQSSDDTLSMTQRAFPDVECISNSENIGRVKNYQKAFERSKAFDFMVNLDGDDYFTDSRWIENGITHLTNHPSCLLYQAQINFIKKLPTSSIIHRIDSDHLVISGLDYILFSISNYSFVHFATIFKSDAAEKVGAYTDDCLHSDFYTALRVALHGEVIVSDKTVGVWRAHDHNASNHRFSSTESSKNESAFYQFVQYAEDYLKGKDILRIIEAYELREFNQDLYLLAINKKSKEILIKAFAQKRFSIFVWKQLLKSLF